MQLNQFSSNYIIWRTTNRTVQPQGRPLLPGAALLLLHKWNGISFGWPNLWMVEEGPQGRKKDRRHSRLANISRSSQDRVRSEFGFAVGTG